MADDLRTGLVEDGRLAFDDRDQWMASVTDPKEDVADGRTPLLAMLGKQDELSLGDTAVRAAIAADYARAISTRFAPSSRIRQQTAKNASAS